MECQSPFEVLEVLNQQDGPGYHYREERVESKLCDQPIIMENCYCLETGIWIGNLETARTLCVAHGIRQFEKLQPEYKVASIGFNPKTQEWYGWSHRALYGFGIGSQTKKGHVGYHPDRGEWEAKTLEDAKQMAIDFAKGVS